MSFGYPKFLTAAINIAGNGDNTVLAASAGIGYKIVKIWFTAASAVNVTFKDGSTALCGAVPLASAPFSFSLLFDDTIQLQTSIGNAFIINLSSGVQVSGMVYYTR